MLQAETQCEIVPGNLTQEVKKEIERQFQPRDFARRPSTVNSFSPAERSHRQNYMADQPRLQISELQFDKNPHTFIVFLLEDKIQNPGKCLFQFPSEAMLRIKEVEMVDSLDALKSSRSIRGESFPSFELLDARIAATLNEIIQISHFKKNVSGQEDGSPRQVLNWRRRAREGSEPACVLSPLSKVAHAGEEGELTSCRGTVQSAWFSSSGESNKEGISGSQG